MTELTRFPLANGGTVIVESKDDSRVVSAGKTEPKPKDAHESLKHSLTSVTDAASEVLDGFRSMMRRPDEVEIEFGVTLDAKFGALIASSSVGAHLTVSLRWNGGQDPGLSRNPDHEKPA